MRYGSLSKITQTSALFFVCYSFLLNAETKLSALAIFNRCYTHVTGLKLPLSHPLRKDVMNGLSPIEACLEVLDSGSLSDGRTNEGRLLKNTTEARAVIRNFNSLHRTWFSNDDIVSSIPNGLDNAPFTMQLHDETEPALHITRALLSPKTPYSEIVTGTSGMEALRSGGPVENASLPATTDDTIPRQFITASSVKNPTLIPISSEVVQKGELLGIRPISHNPRKSEAVAFSIEDPSATPLPIYIHRSLGGGILGAKSFLLLNLGYSDFTFSDGGVRIGRRWAKVVFENLLCRDLPAVRMSDAALYLQTNTTSDTPPFRKASSCLACHSSIDPMAATTRNISYAFVPNLVLVGGPWNASVQIYENPVTLPKETGIVDKDPQFQFRPPFGRLFFRSYSGSLVHRTVSSIANLGEVLSDTDDLYVCAASRYVNYFTGHKPLLYDLGDPASPSLTANEKNVREFAIQLGKDLKKHQSLRNLIEAIVSSDFYQGITSP